MTLADLINACIEAKQGDKAFALFYEPADEGGPDWLPWSAMIGNPDPEVRLGESTGEYSADGHSPEEAVAALLGMLKAESPR